MRLWTGGLCAHYRAEPGGIVGVTAFVPSIAASTRGRHQVGTESSRATGAAVVRNLTVAAWPLKGRRERIRLRSIFGVRCAGRL